jgi:DNA repair protein RadC
VHAVRSTHIFISDLFIRTVLRSIFSKEFNSTSAVATSMYLKGRTKSSSGDAAQASARLTMSPHSSFILAHNIPRGNLQPVISTVNTLLLMVMVM